MRTRRLVTPKNLPTLVTLALFLAMFGAGSGAFIGFFTLQNFLNLFIDNAYLLILGVGMTFVIITGGIDLSVGSMLAFSTMLSSSLLEKSHMNPLFVIPIVLLVGLSLGTIMGFIIQTLTTTIYAFNVPPEIAKVVIAMVVLIVSLLQSFNFRSMIAGLFGKRVAA